MVDRILIQVLLLDRWRRIVRTILEQVRMLCEEVPQHIEEIFAPAVGACLSYDVVSHLSRHCVSLVGFVVYRYVELSILSVLLCKEVCVLCSCAFIPPILLPIKEQVAAKAPLLCLLSPGISPHNNGSFIFFLLPSLTLLSFEFVFLLLIT